MALDEPSRLTGRRTAFRAAFIEQARKFAFLSVDNARLADFFGVDEDTLEQWIEQDPAFSQALEEGRILADTCAVKIREADKVLARVQARENRTAEHARGLALDPTACFLWLKRHRPDPPPNAAGTVSTSKNGHPPTLEDQRAELSDLEVARRVAFILTRADLAHQDPAASTNAGTGSPATPSTGGL